jgi:hypothetical protein
VKKTIVSTILATACSMFMVLAYGLCLFGLFFPNPMVGFADALGLQNSAAMYSTYAFRRDPTTENLIRALDRAIDAGRNTRVVEFAEELFKRETDDEYKDDNIDSYRFQPAYVFSLLELGRRQDAIDFVDYVERYATMQENIDLSRPCNLFIVLHSHPSMEGNPERLLLSAAFGEYFNEFQDEFDRQMDALGEDDPITYELAVAELFILIIEFYFASLWN